MNMKYIKPFIMICLWSAIGIMTMTWPRVPHNETTVSLVTAGVNFMTGQYDNRTCDDAGIASHKGTIQKAVFLNIVTLCLEIGFVLTSLIDSFNDYLVASAADISVHRTTYDYLRARKYVPIVRNVMLVLTWPRTFGTLVIALVLHSLTYQSTKYCFRIYALHAVAFVQAVDMLSTIVRSVLNVSYNKKYNGIYFMYVVY